MSKPADSPKPISLPLKTRIVEHLGDLEVIEEYIAMFTTENDGENGDANNRETAWDLVNLYTRDMRKRAIARMEDHTVRDLLPLLPEHDPLIDVLRNAPRILGGLNGPYISWFLRCVKPELERLSQLPHA